jgi:hypothetical protein
MTVTEKLAEFVRWAVEDNCWHGYDLEGGDVEKKALALGLIKEVEYDPNIHGEAEIEVEPGDPWFVLNDDVVAVLPTPQ